jgi:hypothetical protein
MTRRYASGARAVHGLMLALLRLVPAAPSQPPPEHERRL